MSCSIAFPHVGSICRRHNAMSRQMKVGIERGQQVQRHCPGFRRQECSRSPNAIARCGVAGHESSSRLPCSSQRPDQPESNADPLTQHGVVAHATTDPTMRIRVIPCICRALLRLLSCVRYVQARLFQSCVSAASGRRMAEVEPEDGRLAAGKSLKAHQPSAPRAWRAASRWTWPPLWGATVVVWPGVDLLQRMVIRARA